MLDLLVRHGKDRDLEAEACSLDHAVVRGRVNDCSTSRAGAWPEQRGE